MSNRIWHELGQVRHNVEFLRRYITRAQQRNGLIRILTAILTFGSIAGWYKFAELSIVWAIFLILIQLFNLFKDFFLVSDSKLSTLRTVLSFYNRHCLDLENLWFEFHEERITDEQARKKLTALRKKELEMLELEKHDVISGNKRQRANADLATRQYLARITDLE